MQQNDDQVRVEHERELAVEQSAFRRRLFSANLHDLLTDAEMSLVAGAGSPGSVIESNP